MAGDSKRKAESVKARRRKRQKDRRKQEDDKKRKENTKRKRENQRRELQLDIQSVFSVSDSSKNHQSLRFGDSKVGSICNHFPQPFKNCQTFICFGLM